MRTKKRWAFIAAALMLCAPIVQAELIWQGNYEGYEDGETITYSPGSLVDDKFTSRSATTVTLRAIEYAPGQMGLSISNETTSAKNIRLQAGLTEEHKLVVVSFDWVSGSASTVGLTANPMTPAGTRASGVLPVLLSAENTPGRYTLVMNRTGGDLTLGNGEVLADNTAAIYLKKGSEYSGYGSSSLGTSDIAGFMMTANAIIGVNVLDNIGLWATTDGSVPQWGGRSVMELNYGTVIPEPGTVGLFALGSLLAVFGRRFRR